MGDIGTNPRKIEVMPITKPVHQPAPAPATPAPAPAEPAKEPEKVPA